MKILLLLLIPVLLFSQNINYPDTLYLKSGKIHPCLIKQIDENMVKLIYRNKMQSSAGIHMIDKIYLEQFKIVFENDRFNTEIAALDKFVSLRNNSSSNKNQRLYTELKDYNPEKKWSFGVLYVPYYYGVQDYVYFSYSQPYLITVSEFQTMFESHFSFRAKETTSIIFDIAYNSTYKKQKSRDYDPYYGTYQEIETTDDMAIFVLNAGIKLYFTRIMNNNATGYFQMGLGKQFAFVDDKSGFGNDNQNKINEFVEDVNSPFLINVGIGAEYFFNETLSLNANLRFVYLMYNGELRYDSTSVIEKVEYSEIVNRVGLGINFYF